MSGQTVERRKYQREYARRVRQAALNSARQTSRRCPKRLGKYGVCAGDLRTTTDGIGGTIIVCELCDRRERGICRDCPRPVYGAVRKALRCDVCARRAQRKHLRNYHERNREEVNARARRDLAEMSPERHARRNEVKRLWRKANPEKLKAMKERYTEKYGRKESSQYLKYHRQYNAQAQRQRKKREQAKAAYYNLNPVRPDPHCAGCSVAIAWEPKAGGKGGRPAKWCDACCSRAELRRRLSTRGQPVQPAGKPAVKKVRPLRVRTPMPHRYATSGERLCFTPGCEIVLTHRKKKCSKCKAREVEDAKKQLAAIGGGYSRPSRRAA